MSIKSRLMDNMSGWLNKEDETDYYGLPLTDYERLCDEIRQVDVLLVEGRSRVSEVIKAVTFSPWTHAALYIGRLDQIRDGALQNRIAEYHRGDPREQLLIEAMLGEGTIITTLSKYKDKHLRICRPRGMARFDRDKVIAYAVSQLGYEYDIRHLLDLYRFLLPYTFIPKRWRSTLFKYNAGQSTKNVCSYMLGQAFGKVDYPILPVAERINENEYKLYKSNPRLYCPRDFDYSPYFDIIKYPFFDFDVATYRALPWDTEGVIYNMDGEGFIPRRQGEGKK
jgi:hypothetical protein